MFYSLLNCAKVELKFKMINRSKNINECYESLQFFWAPAQNFLCVTKDDIAISQVGRMPIKQSRQGMAVQSGRTLKTNWKEGIPYAHLPKKVNPKAGYVSSANNHPVDEKYPYYMNFRYDSVYRNQRIREVLESRPKHSVQDMINLQNDAMNLLAQAALPAMLEKFSFELPEQEQRLIQELKEWDFVDRKVSRPAAIFDRWFLNFEEHLWGPRLGPKFTVLFPDESMTIELLAGREPWPLKIEEPPYADILKYAWSLTIKQLKEEMGEDPRVWRLDAYKFSKIPHLARFPGWESKQMSISGTRKTVLSHKGDHGPNWKLVVSMNENPVVKAIYPGGPSGNPLVQRQFERYLNTWEKGELIDIEFLTRDELNQKFNFTVEPDK